MKDVEARGVVGGEGGFRFGLLKEGGGGGGIALRSRSSFVASFLMIVSSFASVEPSRSAIATGASHSFFPTSRRTGRRIQRRKDHEEGGCL